RMWTTANRRGYVASWEVRDDDTLWLTGLQTRLDETADPGLRAVFPDAAGPLEATWVKQRLQVTEGEQLRYVHMGSDSQYARELQLYVWAGRLMGFDEIDTRTRQWVGGSLTAHLEGVFGADESAFLRAVHANPADPAPQLVYADWLDERSDPRANVIRLAYRLRQLDPVEVAREWDPGREAVRGGLVNRLWVWVMGYRDLLEDAPRGLIGA
ncbi:MAG TPA: TIGR02996 domain-containing protein, partial [Gemmataceae bacterium]|nr:TIGR02996 domain-containing protein [Gemmataceae bacterium]